MQYITSSQRTIGKRTIRWDPGPVPQGVDVTAERRGILELFRAWIRATPPSERRQTSRHEASGGRLWLGWWDRNQVFTAVSAELINISRGGALLRAIEPPQELREIWICLDASDTGECVPASVLEVEPVRRGAWSVRIEFSEPCPQGFLAETLVRAESRPSEDALSQP